MITQLINAQGNAVKNQFVVTTTETTSFQSYSNTIAIVDNKTGVVTLDPQYWAYSQTTLKHLKNFLGIKDSKAKIEKDIEKGLYKLESLN